MAIGESEGRRKREEKKRSWREREKGKEEGSGIMRRDGEQQLRQSERQQE